MTSDAVSATERYAPEVQAAPPPPPPLTMEQAESTESAIRGIPAHTELTPPAAPKPGKAHENAAAGALQPLREEKVASAAANTQAGGVRPPSGGGPDRARAASAEPALSDRVAVAASTAPALPVAGTAVESPVDASDDPVARFAFLPGDESWQVVRQALQTGALPPPGQVRVEQLINAFEYHERPPWRGDFRVEYEGGPNPFLLGSRHLMVRIGIHARDIPTSAGLAPIVARDVRAEVEFNPRVVSSYRLIASGSSGVPPATVVRSGDHVTVLYQIKLQPDVRGSAPLGELRIHYRPADGGGGEMTATTRLVTGGFSRNWRTSSPELRLAIVVAAWGEALRRTDRGARVNLGELVARAAELEAGEDKPEKIRTLQNLIDTTRELLTPAPGHP